MAMMPTDFNNPDKIIDVRQHLPEVDTNLVSDGYHTFGELYEHRIELFMALCRHRADNPRGPDVWRSQLHSDGSSIEGWFIAGIGKEPGTQITYHLPLSRWSDFILAETLEKAPEWDGHTPADVLDRLREL